VDADGDGVRNPQDIDDAALGTAVYLCSGDDDLGTPAGQRAAVFRYNHSQSYVDLVLSIMEAYTQGDFTSVPNSTVAAGYLVKAPTPIHVGNAGHGGGKGIQHESVDNQGESNEPSAPTSSAPPASGGGTGGGSGLPGGGGGGSTDGPKAPHVTVPPAPSTSVQPVDEALTLAQATAQCIADGIDQILQPDKFAQCVDDYMHPKTAAQRKAVNVAQKRIAAEAVKP
jgi:hypothetical protein